MSRVVPPDVVARIKDETDIVEVIRQYVSLKPAGASFKGLCPFHTEKTPSFIVTPARQMYKCFGCGEGGDVLSFVMGVEGISFPEALEMLARPLDIDLSNLLQDDESEGEKRAYHRAGEVSSDFWQASLWDDRDGTVARRYLDERGFSREVLQRFKVGWAPKGSDRYMKALAKGGVSQDLALQCGLLRQKDGRSPFAYFRQRVIFPIENISKQIAGFGGRVIDQGEPKYLNSSDNTYFSKGKLLYGFAASRMPIARLKTAILVEGYLDLLALAQAGFANVVANCGTAFTIVQAKLLRRGCRTVVLLFDGDRAGLQAAVRASHLALSVGLEPKIARLPDGEDPDSLLHKQGQKAMQDVLGNAQGYLQFLLSLVEEKGAGRSGQERALRQALGTIGEVADPLRKEYLLQEAAELFEVGIDILRRALADQQTATRYRSRKHREEEPTEDQTPDSDNRTEPSPTRMPTGIRNLKRTDWAAIEDEMFAHVLKDDSGEAARVAVSEREKIPFSSPEAERLGKDLVKWLAAKSDGDDISPADFIQQRWNEQTDSRFRNYVVDLITKEEVPDQGEFVRVIRDSLRCLAKGYQLEQ